MKKTFFNGLIFFILFSVLNSMQLFSQSIMTDPGAVLASKSVAVVGVEYKYQVPGPSGVRATFKLVRGPSGMTIDTLTGVVKWTPTAKGIYSAEVKITPSTMKTSSYAWTIQVVNFLGSIKGVVKNENNEPLRWVMITLYKKTDRVEVKSVTTSLSAVTDTGGAYTIVVADSGEFFVYASPGASPLMSPIKIGDAYIPLWYIDSPTMAGATPILVKDATPFTANFVLKKYQPPVQVAISGTVSGSDGKPIAGATVVASVAANTAARGAVTSLASFQDPGFGLFCDVGAKERTDSLGRYKLSVLSGSAYVIAAYKEGYSLQYYNGKSGILDADKLTLKRDTAGINFKLSAIPVVTSKISGVVVDSAKTGVPARVMLYPVAVPKTAILMPTPITRSVNTDSLGVFTFTSVASGKYIIQVAPIGKYLPSYFKANDCGVREVRYADTIVVKDNQTVSGVTVCVKKVVANGGGTIKGSVRNSAGSGLPGVVVLCESQNSSSYAITENDGSYEITDLDPGLYTVLTDKVGYTSSVSTSPVIDYAAGLFSSEADFTLAESIVTSVEPSTGIVPESFVLYRNYPNPFNPSTQISFDLPSNGYVTLRVYNMLGQLVATMVDGMRAAGRYSVTFDAGNALSSGVYLYELKFKERVAVNKMILMK